jgi:integration host factor subunit beta
VALAGKHVPHFKPGKELRDRVNESFLPTEEVAVPAPARAAGARG